MQRAMLSKKRIDEEAVFAILTKVIKFFGRKSMFFLRFHHIDISFFAKKITFWCCFGMNLTEIDQFFAPFVVVF